MSVLGTVIGCVLALPVAILSSSNINRSLPLVSFFRFILALIRTLPTLIIALVCALIFSLGTFSGTVAIAIFTFGIVAKMLFEEHRDHRYGAFPEGYGRLSVQTSSRPSGRPAFLRSCPFI